MNNVNLSNVNFGAELSFIAVLDQKIDFENDYGRFNVGSVRLRTPKGVVVLDFNMSSFSQRSPYEIEVQQDKLNVEFVAEESKPEALEAFSKHLLSYNGQLIDIEEIYFEIEPEPGQANPSVLFLRDIDFSFSVYNGEDEDATYIEKRFNWTEAV